ncbi:MAG TPA: hypothetical protein VGA61_18755, partial [Anaerolineae bacterium]
RLARRPALAGALAFMFSDAFLVHFGNLNFNAVASWTPWVFWAYLSGLPGGVADAPPRYRFGYAALAGAVLALGSLAGHIQATLFILLALAVYSAAWLWSGRGTRPAGRATVAGEVEAETAWASRQAQAGDPAAAGWRGPGLGLLYLALAAAVTTVLAAPTLLPALQLSGLTQRAAWNYQEAAGYAIAPSQWIGLLVPGFFGRAPQFHWGAWPRVEVGYLGILPLVLVGLAIGLRRGRQVWAWLALAGVAFVLALGPYALPHGWLTLLPGFGQLRAPARFGFVADLALAALAAAGLDAALSPHAAPGLAALDRVRRLTGWATAAALGVIAPLAYLALLLVQGSDPNLQSHVSVALIGVMTFGGLLLASLLWLQARRGRWVRPVTLGWLALALILFDLGSNGAYQDLGNQDPSRAFAQPAIAGYLAGRPGIYRIDSRTSIQGQWQPDTALLYGLEDVDGLANPLLLADASRFWEGLGSRSSRLYDLLDVRYVIAKKDVVLDWQKFSLAYDGDSHLNVYVNRNWLPRAFPVAAWQAVGSHEDAWQAIHAAGFDPAAQAVVEGSLPGAAVAAQARGQATVTGLATIPNGLRLQVQVESAPALVVVSQVWYPGWQVTLDGQPQGAPLRADYLFQGIIVPAGAHEVTLQFAPPLWRAGWWLAAAGAVALAAWAALAARRRG